MYAKSVRRTPDPTAITQSETKKLLRDTPTRNRGSRRRAPPRKIRKGANVDQRSIKLRNTTPSVKLSTRITITFVDMKKVYHIKKTKEKPAFADFYTI